MQLALIFVIFQRNLSYDFPKFARKQFHHKILFCHVKLPQRKLCTVTQFQCRTNIQNRSTLSIPLLFTDILVQHVPLASQSLFPLRKKIQVIKNRVVRFPTRIDLLKLKYDCWFMCSFRTAYGFIRVLILKIFLKFFLLFLSLF